jgi:hypothetical protein
MARIIKAAFVAASLFVIAPANAGMTESASPNDTARVLAGLQPSAGSPLMALTQDGAWRQHASRFDALFGAVDHRQLGRIRAWSSAKLTSPSDVLFYMFSGPDFLYANAFFPNASTYVMAGLEPPGPIPDLTKFSRGTVGSGLRGIEASLRSLVSYSFFQTKEMRRELAATPVRGTLPLLYVFLARSGKTIRDVTLIKLDENGSVLPASGDEGGKGARGAKIVFAGSDGRERTLYYFGTNIANDGFKASGFAKFCERLGAGDALVKSASYLLHDGGFSDVRNFLLEHSRSMVQDDTGVPVSYFERGNWQLRPFGHYIGPISIFPGKYQPKLARLFDKGHESIDFGIGYRWRSQGSNLLLAIKADAPTTAAVANAPVATPAGAVAVVDQASSSGNAAPTADDERNSTTRSRSASNGKHASRDKSAARTHKRHVAYRAPWFYWSGGWR